MAFFFDTVESSGKDKNKNIPLDTARKLECAVCPLKNGGAYHSNMPPWGSSNPVVYFLGEAPGETKDKANRPFSGSSGVFLEKHIPASFKSSYRLNNTVRCFISPKVKVFTLDGYKMIKDVQVGELVLTHTGQFKRVLSRLHDLPYTSRSYKEDLIEVLVELNDYGLRTQSPGTIKQTVTLYHRYLKADGSWIEAKDLKDDDTVVVLASICEQCGKPYFGTYNGMRTHDFCSPNCHNQYVSSINGAAISRYMTTAIKSGVRSQVNLHKAAATARKNLLESGQHNFQNMSQLSRFKQCKTKTWHNVGENEDAFKQALIDAGYIVKPQKSFAIEEDLKVVVYDLYIESLNVVIEVDGKSHNNHKVWRQDEYKNQVATNLGLTLLRVDAYSDPIKLVSQLQRLKQNHNGEYKFTTAKIKVKRYPPKRTTYLYCLEVEGDSSFIANGIVSHNSRPPANRTPTALELACCRNSIVKDIHLTKPAVIVAVGGTALNWLFDGDGAQDIGKWRGKFFPVNIDGYQCHGYCIYHPSYVIRNQRTNRNGEIYKGDLDYLFEADMKRLFGYVREGNFAIETYTDYMSGIQYTEGLKSDRELEKVVNWLNEIDSYPIVAIDYETTHLRPFYSNAKILSVAIGTDKKTFSFPIDYPNAWNERQAATVKERLKRFLYNKTTKIAQNAKFELEWSCFFFGEGLLKLTRWEDTQGMAYVLDERKGTHNLDFMIREHFGFWLKKLSNLDRANLIQQPLSKVLPYNALDTKWTYKLYWRLLDKFSEEPKLKKVYDNLITMMMMLTHVQLRGVLFSPSACDDLREEYEGKLNDIEHCIKTSQEADLYKQYTNSVFNPRSPNNILLMFRDVLKQGDAMQTNNKISTDSTVLTKLATSVPFAQMILDHRLYAKKISTYIDPMPNFVMPDGRIHTTYNPYETTTGRLCVAKGTMIEIMRDYSKYPLGIPVEEVKTGDYAYTYDDDLNIVLRKVTWAGKTGVKKVMRLHWIGDGHKTKGYLDVTCNHPIRLINGEYCRADQLKIGDRVLSLTRTIKHGRSLTIPNNHQIVKIEWLDNMVDVYDLGVEDTHNFIANGLAISNSSDSPNLQNWPSKTGKEPRRMLVAPKGMLFVCCDYGQIEARLIGAASQDKNFCKALWENYDVHMEWAKKIANEYPRVVGGKSQLEDPKALKTFRSKVKNLWVFPAFYGASYKSISAGIGVPEDITFELFGDFWEQFEGVRKWQRWLLQRYNQCGYVESLFGRRRHAPLTANAVYNSAIQSSASDICVLSMVELNKLGLEVVLNVHDEIGFYVPENELEDQIEQIVKVMTKPRLSWLNIPISVEVKVGENWFEMEEVLTVDSTNFHSVSRKLLDFTKIYEL